ncbi:MAG: hypothetical protein HWN67_11880 [Candidatus Helarchaeota archaeon]|nr:hypothetical protein [Candidatus Helarchaeota archaeon]
MKKSKKQTVVLSIDQREKIKVPIVKSPSRILDKRLGKGFSIKEIKAASIPISEFHRLNLKIDYRRRTIYDSNAEFLGKKYRELLSEELIEREALEKLAKKEQDIIKILTKIPSISKKFAKKLVDAGVKSIENLIDEDTSSLAIDIGEKEKIVNQWIKDAKKFKDLVALDDTINNLCKIDILNKEKAKHMASIGIISLEILAEEKASILAKDLGVSEYLANEWIKKANQLSKKDIKTKKVAKKKKITKKREEPIVKVSKKVKAKPKELSLKDIGGIGKKDLKSLETLEITTLKQLAEEDPLEISSIIGVGKDQVFRWINKARELLGMPRLEEVKKKKKIPTIEKIEKKEEAIEETVDFSTLEEELEEAIEEEAKELELEEIEPGEIQEKFVISEEDKKEILKELFKIKGVGKVSGEKLVNAGIRSIKALIEANIEELSSSTGIKEQKLQKFIEEAKKLE